MRRSRALPGSGAGVAECRRRNHLSGNAYCAASGHTFVDARNLVDSPYAPSDTPHTVGYSPYRGKG